MPRCDEQFKYTSCPSNLLQNLYSSFASWQFLRVRVTSNLLGSKSQQTPSGSLSQQLSEVQQHLRERKARAVPQASDKNPEARSRAYRERIRSEADADLQANGLAAAEGEEPEESEDDNEMIREAKAKAKAKKERKAAEAAAKVKAKVAKQYRPESNVEACMQPAMSWVQACTTSQESP